MLVKFNPKDSYEDIIIFNKSVRLASKHHKGQKDKGGSDYILHPLRVSNRLLEYEVKYRIVAVLHDILEDTAITEDCLRKEFNKEIVDAVVALTRRKEETYMQYIERLESDKIAREVKIADLKENMDLSRIASVDIYKHKDLMKRYSKAIDFLSGKSKMTRR